MSLWVCLSPFGPASVILDEPQQAEKVQGGVCLGLGPCPRSGLLPGEWHREEGGGNVCRWAEKGMLGWTVAALLRHFRQAPEKLYVQAKAAG
jgi:hypothetical protein